MSESSERGRAEDPEAAATGRKRRATRPAEEGFSGSEMAEVDPFEKAVTGYHACVRQAIGRYERRLQDLNSEWSQAVEAAGREGTFEAQQRALRKANEGYANGIQENIRQADTDVEECLRQYAGDLKNAFAHADADSLGAAKLDYIGRETSFIANAAVGAFPPEWWRPLENQVGAELPLGSQS